LPGNASLTRAIGVAEIAVGAWVFTAPGILAGAAMAVLYAAFAGFVVFLLLARPQTASCGCAGAKDVPPSVIHIVMNALAAASGIGVALTTQPSFAHALSSLGWGAAPFLLGIVTAGVLAVIVVTDLPPALAAFTRPPGHPVEADKDRHVRAEEALATVGVGPGHASLWPDTEPPGV
jgi:hypothetical protein